MTSIRAISPTRVVILKLVAYSEVTLVRTETQEATYVDRNTGLFTGSDTAAIEWLIEREYVRAVGGQNAYGFTQGLMRPTGKGELWLYEMKDRARV
jgi:hypothetical protein